MTDGFESMFEATHVNGNGNGHGNGIANGNGVQGQRRRERPRQRRQRQARGRPQASRAHLRRSLHSDSCSGGTPQPERSADRVHPRAAARGSTEVLHRIARGARSRPGSLRARQRRGARSDRDRDAMHARTAEPAADVAAPVRHLAVHARRTSPAGIRGYSPAPAARILGIGRRHRQRRQARRRSVEGAGRCVAVGLPRARRRSAGLDRS